MSGFETQEDVQRFLQKLNEHVVPALNKKSIGLMMLVKEQTVKEYMAMSIGMVILLDCPIVAIIEPGAQIPEKLAKVIDRFVEFNLENLESVIEGVREAVADICEGNSDV